MTLIRRMRSRNQGAFSQRPAGVALVRDHCRKPLGEAKPPLRLRQQHDAAIRAEASAVKGGCDLLRSTAGNANGNKLSWAVAGVARSNLLQGSASATKSYARSKAYATPPTCIRLRHE
jgi:hypothetical protein